MIAMSTIFKILKIIIPKKFKLMIIYNYLKIFKKLDDEMFYTLKMCKTRRLAIDIGANSGLYSYFYSKHFNEIKSFEPFKSASKNLVSSNIKNIDIHNVALSSKTESLILHVPILKDGSIIHSQASLKKDNENSLKVNVKCKTLDSYHFNDVDLIKIDVEGYEEEVLIGAIKTIKRYMPILQIELEERHLGHTPTKLINFIENLGYNAYVYFDKEFIKAIDFPYVSNQRNCIQSNSFENYCNNFIFIPIK